MSHPSRLSQPNFIGWLTEVVKLPQYRSNLIKNGYDTFQIVQHIKIKSQLTEIGITKIGHQIQLLQAINNLEKPTIPSYSPLNKFQKHSNIKNIQTQSEPQYHISVNCHICKAHFNDADEYEKHISDEYKKDPGKTWLECDFCTKFDDKPANNSTTFISHITTHLDGGGLYKCEFQQPGKEYKCGKSFGTKTGMKGHWKNQHNFSSKSSHNPVEVDMKINSNTNSNDDNSNSNSYLNRIPKHSNLINTNSDIDNTNNNNVKENSNTPVNKDNSDTSRYRDRSITRSRSRSRSRSRNKRHRRYRDRDRDRRYKSRSHSRSSSVSRDRDSNRNRNLNRNKYNNNDNNTKYSRSHSRLDNKDKDRTRISMAQEKTEKQLNNNKHKGEVSWFKRADKGFGVIIDDDNDKEIFVYCDDIHSKSHKPILTKGDKVEFEVRWDEIQNRPKAVNVTGPDGAFIGCDRDRNRNRDRDRYRDRDRGKHRNYKSRSRSSDGYMDRNDKRNINKNNNKNNKNNKNNDA